MYRKLSGLVVCILVVASSTVSAQQTGYADDFSGRLASWGGGNAYSVTQDEGVLEVAVNKSTKWQGLYLDLGGVYDISANPYVNFKAKSTEPCVLHVYVLDGNGNALIPLKVRAVEDLVDFCYDFTGAEGVNLKAIKALIFTVNGAANSWTGNLTFDDLRVGDKAVRRAFMEGVHNRIHYRDTGAQTALLTGLANVRAVQVKGANDLVRNAAVRLGEDGQAELSYELIPGATGEGLVTLSAQGAQGYQAVDVNFRLTVEDNLAPRMDQPGDLTVQAGRPAIVALDGLSDGNIAAEQPLTLSVRSSDANVVDPAKVVFEHSPGSPHAAMLFTPAGSGAAEMAVTVSDGGASATQTFKVTVVKEWNEAPTVATLPVQQVFLDAEERIAILTGISDGDVAEQPLTVSARSADPAIIASPVVVDYDGGSTARLHLVPGGTAGSTTVSVTVTDGGGTADNNGDRSVEMQFTAVARVRPLEGMTVDLGNLDEDAWRAEAGLQFEQAQMDGANVLHVTARDKVTFAGLWLTTPDLDLREYPYLTVDIRPDAAMDFNAYFYDGNQMRNDGASQTKKVPGGRWTTVTFDFTGDGAMATNKGKPIDAGWITTVLLNFHPKLGWPFSSYNGNIYFRNIRIGSDADIPDRRPVCTLDPLPNQVHLDGAGEVRVKLTGIGSGSAAAPSVRVTSAGPVSNVRLTDDESLVYTVSRVGRAEVTVTVNAVGSDPVERKFAVDVFPQALTGASTIGIDGTRRAQVVHGFGTFRNDIPAELYAGKLGASAMRVGLIEQGTQIEPVNDNSDPYVLNREALNYGAFDWAHLRELREAGVETFILTSWSPPAWMKANLSLNYQQPGNEGNTENTENRLDYYQYEEFAESMVAAYRMFQEEAGIDLAGIGLQNEPTFHEPYASAILAPAHFCALIKVVGRRFDREGISTKFFMPEQVFSQTASMRAYIAALNADTQAQKYCQVVATHGYDNKGVGEARPDFTAWQDMWNRSQQGVVPKEMWMTETYPGHRDWGSAFRYAQYLYGSLEFGNIGLWTSWGIEGQLIDRGSPNDSFWTCSQFWRYVRPGAQRVASNSGDAEVLATSYVLDEDDGGNVVSVLINRSDSGKALRVFTRGTPDVARWTVVTTDAVRHQETMGTVAAGGLVLLPPQSVTTILANAEAE